MEVLKGCFVHSNVLAAPESKLANANLVILKWRLDRGKSKLEQLPFEQFLQQIEIGHNSQGSYSYFDCLLIYTLLPTHAHFIKAASITSFFTILSTWQYCIKQNSDKNFQNFKEISKVLFSKRVRMSYSDNKSETGQLGTLFIRLFHSILIKNQVSLRACVFV